VWPTFINALVGLDTAPGQGLFEIFFRAGHIARLVGIFYPEDESSFMLAGKKVII
jgi:hypothetical protein